MYGKARNQEKETKEIGLFVIKHSNPVNRLNAIWIMLAVIFFDQLTKILIRVKMPIFQAMPVAENVFGELFRISHVKNDGAAFSLSLPNPAYNRIFLISITIVAIALIAYMLYKAAHKIQVIAYGLVLGGAIGNLIDRVIFGVVTDFIDVDFPDFIMHRFPVFNIADTAINIAMVLLIIDILFIQENKRIRDNNVTDSSPIGDKES
ncbi:MAG: signal peptidase II [Candidatus Cloacimonetes bacterium HGW-Cloacimonetes-1]|jgi:signal peptidase II|nr:MAG: signal peptidase II [Candidatus Cloacimonetes bacterium HGW-Cloacimonetes-1]